VRAGPSRQRRLLDIRAHRPDGRPDPTGLVKGWSLENAGRILEAAGARDYCINGGGDVVVRGEAAPGKAWRVGIRHPLIADRLATVLAVRGAAVATSGAYERGAHIRDPFTGQAPGRVLSFTVVGPSLTSGMPTHGRLRDGPHRARLGGEPA